MSSSELHADRLAVLSSIATSTGLHPYNAELGAFVASRLDMESKTLKPLREANAARQQQVRTAIQKAANEYLTVQYRQRYARSRWTGSLRGWLERRYAKFGLDCWPCERTVRLALKFWVPPNGGAGKT